MNEPEVTADDVKSFAQRARKAIGPSAYMQQLNTSTSVGTTYIDWGLTIHAEKAEEWTMSDEPLMFHVFVEEIFKKNDELFPHAVSIRVRAATATGRGWPIVDHTTISNEDWGKRAETYSILYDLIQAIRQDIKETNGQHLRMLVDKVRNERFREQQLAKAMFGDSDEQSACELAGALLEVEITPGDVKSFYGRAKRMIGPSSYMTLVDRRVERGITFIEWKMNVPTQDPWTEYEITVREDFSTELPDSTHMIALGVVQKTRAQPDRDRIQSSIFSSLPYKQRAASYTKLYDFVQALKHEIQTATYPEFEEIVKQHYHFESKKVKWVDYDRLTPEHQKALYQFMVLDGGVSEDEYPEHVRKWQYFSQTFPAQSIADVFDSWGWTKWKDALDKGDEERIADIERRQSKGQGVWPYVVGEGHNFKEWASDEMNHGDGYHRMVVSLRKNIPVEFLFMRSVLSEAKGDVDPEADIGAFVRRALFWQKKWSFVPAIVRADDPAELDPLKIRGSHHLYIKLPTYKTNIQAKIEVLMMFSRGEYENATYHVSIDWSMFSEVGTYQHSGMPIQSTAHCRPIRFDIVEDEWPEFKQKFEDYFEEVARPQLEAQAKEQGKVDVQTLHRSLVLKWHSWWKPFTKRSWSDTYEKAVWYHYGGQIPPDVQAQLADLRVKGSKIGEAQETEGEEEEGYEPSPEEIKTLAARALGPQMYAKIVPEQMSHSENVDIKHYKWEHRTTYTAFLTIVVTTVKQPFAGASNEGKPFPNIQIWVKPYVETLASRFMEGVARKPYYVSMDEKGLVFQRLWDFIGNIKASMKAGMDPMTLHSFIGSYLNSEEQKFNKYDGPLNKGV